MDHFGRLTAGCLIALAVVATSLSGCGRGEPRGRIAGKVTLQGTPVPTGRVYFRNTDKGICMGAVLKEDGSYEVLTAQGAGLPVGEYVAWLTPPPPVPRPLDAPPEPVRSYDNIPAKYRNGKTSGLTLTVKERENRFDIDMSP